jgi:hypothetical protein
MHHERLSYHLSVILDIYLSGVAPDQQRQFSNAAFTVPSEPDNGKKH